ncbi:hypothetical protein [Achromobacter phage Motura]|uniref:Uncharacterized protein n=1 Tax=Achromobacter phage Motura TaxID=2591403 RepID=A0A514CT72_9CAUD|nr:hypothetical protein H1O15_gp084 [Achromobacter phage Motura]QDH83666.1 hypothetical protein [Achromobacter phage Motura]
MACTCVQRIAELDSQLKTLQRELQALKDQMRLVIHHNEGTPSAPVMYNPNSKLGQ